MLKQLISTDLLLLLSSPLPPLLIPPDSWQNAAMHCGRPYQRESFKNKHEKRKGGKVDKKRTERDIDTEKKERGSEGSVRREREREREREKAEALLVWYGSNQHWSLASASIFNATHCQLSVVAAPMCTNATMFEWIPLFPSWPD